MEIEWHHSSQQYLCPHKVSFLNVLKIQNEIVQKEENKYYILMHVCAI